MALSETLPEAVKWVLHASARGKQLVDIIIQIRVILGLAREEPVQGRGACAGTSPELPGDLGNAQHGLL